MQPRPPSLAFSVIAIALLPTGAASAADLSCAGLVPPGLSLVCAGFEPNWAIELTCDGAMAANYTDAFSGAITVTAGDVSVLSQKPWRIETSHPVAGTIARTPAGCIDESNRIDLLPGNVSGFMLACSSREERSDEAQAFQ